MSAKRAVCHSRIQWSKAICKEPANYIGWPTIARKSDGELLAVFSGDREEHVCPYGKTEMVRSFDGGLTWSPLETINNSPLDDRDAGIVVMPSGTIVVSWFTSPTWDHLDFYRRLHSDSVVDAWARHLSKVSPEDRSRWLGHWTRRSVDGGRTWEPAVDCLGNAPHGPIVLSDGRLIYVGNGRPLNLDLIVAESTDEGRSWHWLGAPPTPNEDLRVCEEPHCVETAGGRLVSLWRYQPEGRNDEWYLHQSESEDGGRTWSVPHPTPMWGHPPHLVRLHNGDLLASYGHRRPPYGQRACLSHDGGRSWDIEHEIVIRDDAPNADLGYPASLELEPGEILTVYYQIDQPGEKTSLMLTRWSLA